MIIANIVVPRHNDDQPLIAIDELVREPVQKIQGFVILPPEISFGVRGSVFHALNDIAGHDDKVWWLYPYVLLARIPVAISL